MARIRTVDQQVSDLAQRTRGLETLQVFVHRVQQDSLRKAEQLRKMVLGTCTKGVINQDQITRLADFARGLGSFHDPRGRGRMPAALRRLIRQDNERRKRGR